mmetsp:Transcript_31669/g.69211  ORF Transcript_31669/g.69211 Transcript_31669/m.69211 type:complete len:339 (-) Transcript_31669:417-1433(-)
MKAACMGTLRSRLCCFNDGGKLTRHERPANIRNASAAAPRHRSDVCLRTESQSGFTRRILGISTVTSIPLVAYLVPPEAGAVGGGLADRAWEVAGQANADLYFPDAFEGTWDVYTSLFDVQVPFGEDLLGDYKGIRDRAQQEVGNRVIKAQRRYVRNRSGRLVNDRRFSYASLASVYLGDEQCDAAGEDPVACLERRIEWDVDDPNVLNVRYKSGTNLRLLTTRRNQDAEGPNKFSTSEYYQETFEKATSSTEDYDLFQRPSTEVRAAQKFTKYKLRSEAAAAADGGPVIVGTQVVSYYVNALDNDKVWGDAAAKALQTRGRPVLQLSSKLAFVRPSQ